MLLVIWESGIWSCLGLSLYRNCVRAIAAEGETRCQPLEFLEAYGIQESRNLALRGAAKRTAGPDPNPR